MIFGHNTLLWQSTIFVWYYSLKMSEKCTGQLAVYQDNRSWREAWWQQTPRVTDGVDVQDNILIIVPFLFKVIFSM